MNSETTPSSMRSFPWREGCCAGLVLGLSDLLATGPWRIPLTLAVLIVGAPLLGGLLAACLALPFRRRGVATALALFGAVALNSVSLVTKEFNQGPALLILSLLLALACAGLSLGSTASSTQRADSSASLLALVAIPAGSLLASSFAFAPWASLLGIALPLIVLLISRARSPRVLVLSASVLLLWLPMPVLLLDRAPEPAQENAPVTRALTGAAAEAAPDVLLIVIDTLRADAMDWTAGNPRTPNLAALAESGTRFEQAISSASWTLPAMSSLLTGLLPTQHGAIDRRHALPREVTTLAERFRQNGYRTAAFTGGAFVDPSYGLAQGFETFDAQADYWFAPLRVHVPLAWRVVKNRFWPQRWILRQVSEFGGLASIRSNLTEFMREQDERPLLLMLHTYQLHDYYIYQSNPDDSVWNAHGPPPSSIGKRLSVHPDELLTMGAQEIAWFERIYRARLELVDRELGVLLAEFRDARRGRRCLVILTADHGEGFDVEHGRLHHGGRLHDDLLRVPLVLTAMDAEGTQLESFGQPRVVSEQVSHVDLVPTLLELFGLEPLGELAGTSMLASLSGAGEYPAAAWAEDHLAKSPRRALRTKEWKLMDTDAGPKRFAIENDPGETDALDFLGAEWLNSLWDSFDQRFPPGARTEAILDAGVQDQLDRIGYTDSGSEDT